MNDISWNGVPLTEIIGSDSPWGAPEFPLVVPSRRHAVLYHVSRNGTVAFERSPKPHIANDKWDSEFVKMPCSDHSLYPVEDSTGHVRLKKRWSIIEYVLSKPIHNSTELAQAILAYNTKFKNIWKFTTLHKLFNEYLEEEETLYFFEVTLPEIAKLALALPKLVRSPIPLLRQHSKLSISLSQHQIASLLANAFFCTYPRRNTIKKTAEYANYPNINFNSLFNSSGSESNLEKLKCICHYFRRVSSKVPTGVVTFARRSVPVMRCPEWSRSEALIGTLPIHIDSDKRIEDAQGLIQVDFANKYLGGGILGYGCVQEEIRFAICPELIISMLFTESMRANEAVMIIGVEQYSKYTGYGSDFQWAGDYQDKTPFDSSGRRRCAVLAIDALPFRDPMLQYKPDMIDRELNKAWVGFSFFMDTDTDTYTDTAMEYPGLATGNWGCGAFGGSPQLKWLIQVAAATQARRPLVYCTFGDPNLREEILNGYNMLSRHNVTVGQLYKYITEIKKGDISEKFINSYLQRRLDEQAKQKIREKYLFGLSENRESEEGIFKLSKSTTESDSPDIFYQDEIENATKVESPMNQSKIQEITAMSLSVEKVNPPDEDMPSIEREIKSDYTMCSNIDKMDFSGFVLKSNDKTDANNDRIEFSDMKSKINDEPTLGLGKVNLNTCRKQINFSSVEVKFGYENTEYEIGRAKSSECKVTDVRRSLFDAMKRYDEDLKLKKPSPSSSSLKMKNHVRKSVATPFKLKIDKTVTSSDRFSKKLGGKMTDYFSKKTI